MISNAKVKAAIWDYLGYLISGSLAIAYVLVQSVGIVQTDKSLWEILANGAALFIVTNIMRSVMLSTGTHRGYASEGWKATAEEHEVRINAAKPNMHLLKSFLVYDYLKRLEMARIIKLRGVEHDLMFNAADGTIKDYTRSLPSLVGLNKKQKKEKMRAYKSECKCIEKARKVTVPLYTSAELFTRGASRRRMFTSNPKRAAAITILSGAFLTVILAVIDGFYDSSGFKWVEFISAIGISLIAIAFSFVAFYQGYTYITQTMRGDIIDKIHYLDEFNEWAKNQNKGEN